VTAHALVLDLLSIFGDYSWRAHIWKVSSCYFWILGFDHIFSCGALLYNHFLMKSQVHYHEVGALHPLGIVHIHPWSWLPWISHVEWLYACILGGRISCGHLAYDLV
jgi:hypothetical protein